MKAHPYADILPLLEGGSIRPCRRSSCSPAARQGRGGTRGGMRRSRNQHEILIVAIRAREAMPLWLALFRHWVRRSRAKNLFEEDRMMLGGEAGLTA